MIHLAVGITGPAGGVHSVLLQKTEQGLVVFDPNHAGPQKARVVQTSQLSLVDGPTKLGQVMLHYSPNSGEDVTAVIYGAARANIQAPTPDLGPAPRVPDAAVPAPSVKLPRAGL